MAETENKETPEAPELETPASGIRSIIKLAIALFLSIGLFVLMGWTSVLIIILILITMVILHEFGHFITAKKSGMKVTQFFVGFGPKLWSIRRGETEYGVKAIPAGGYCRIVGMTSEEELHPSDEPRAYVNQPFYKRIIVASAGSAMHFLLAFLIAFSALYFIGQPNPSAVVVSGYIPLSGHQVTPAQKAGLVPGDQIISVNAKTVNSTNSLESVVRVNSDQAVVLVVSKDGVTRKVIVTPANGQDLTVKGSSLAPKSGKPIGYIGVMLKPGTVQVGPFGAIVNSGKLVGQATKGSVIAIAHLFSPAGISNYIHQVVHPSTKVTSNRPESIIGAVRTASQAQQASIFAMLYILISINIFLAVVNMLPMLPLDGGHVAIATYEWIRTKKGKAMYRADINKLVPFAYALMAFLLLLVVGSAYLDIAHPIANPFR